MKNIKIKDLAGVICIDSKALLTGIEKRKDFAFFVSGPKCPKCRMLRQMMAESHENPLFEIEFDEYLKFLNKAKDYPFVYSFPTVIIVENGTVTDFKAIGDDVENTLEWIESHKAGNAVVIDNPFGFDKRNGCYKGDSHSISEI